MPALADESRLNSPGVIEVAFGPEGAAAEGLILRSIASAGTSINVAAYAFSSPAIVDALKAARERGVDVRLVVDYKHNVGEDRKGIGRKALDALVAAGAVARTNSSYRLHHDKYMIIDARHVQTGSYNYAVSANLNSENVMVIRDDPVLARQYLAHWTARFGEGTDYRTR
ncbi:MAG: phospholipase D family protein [Betaproteobacteria bacterium]|nr:phospholipase D family protein [Betaproteobacteria bacterium]